MITTIHPDTRMGPVSLYVQNLERSLDYYRTSLGMIIHKKANSSAQLGAGNEVLLELDEKPGGRSVHESTGLYHFALLVPSRADLAHSLQNLISTETPVQGFADHLVSEAIYLADPDKNGIEVYRDRPEAEWPRENGRLLIGTEPLDIEGVLSDMPAGDVEWGGLDSRTSVGHIHLRVSDVGGAEEFYTEVIGFDLVMRYGPSAGFVSAGGYHHHIGYNSWTSDGAPPPPDDALGLKWFTVLLHSGSDLEQIKERCHRNGISIDEMDDGLIVRDPSQNCLLLKISP